MFIIGCVFFKQTWKVVIKNQKHFFAGNATSCSPCRSVHPSYLTFFAFLSCLKVENTRYEYFMDVNAPAQIISAIAQIISAPAQLIIAPAQLDTAPAQPPTTGLSCIRPCFRAFQLFCKNGCNAAFKSPFKCVGQ